MAEAGRGPFEVRWAGPTPAEHDAFARMVLPYLARRETANNLQLAILEHVRGRRYREALLLLAEDATGDTAAVLMRTPPHDLIVCAGDVDTAREALLAALLESGDRPPGMVGPLPDVERAAAWWSRHAGVEARRAMHQGVYRLGAVTRRDRAPGRMRAAEERDRYLAVPWLEAFGREAVGDASSDGSAIWASFQGSEIRRLYLWETPHGRVVSLAGIGGRTPNGVRVGPVYTPRSERRRGYAGALVAALSAHHLERGARFCFLFTDLDYPTSNRVYRDVGYELVGEAAQYAFSAT